MTGQRGNGEYRDSYGYGDQRTEMIINDERRYSRETDIPTLQNLSVSDDHGLTQTSAHGYVGNARLDYDRNTFETRGGRSGADRPTALNGRDRSDSHRNHTSRKYMMHTLNKESAKYEFQGDAMNQTW